MWILVLNCGSSSVKFALLNPESGEVRLSGLAERLGTPQASLRADRAVGGSGAAQRHTRPLDGGGYAAALGALLEELDAVGGRAQVEAVGHRVVHGGQAFRGPARITPEVLEAVRACLPLAPLHNPANIAGIEAARAAERLGLPMARAATPGTDPRFVSMITDLVVERRSQPAQVQALGSLPPGPDFCPNDCCRVPAARPAAPPGAGR